MKKGTLPSRLRSEVTRTSTESEVVSRPYLTLKSFPRLTIVLEKGGAFFVFSRSDCLAEVHWGKLRFVVVCKAVCVFEIHLRSVTPNPTGCVAPGDLSSESQDAARHIDPHYEQS